MKNLKKYIGAAVLGGLVLMLPGCSDTWDEHYNAGEGTSATESLWEVISNNPNLSRFKAIAEKATYYRDETHPQANYTFKDMLESSMLSTVWVPENDAFTDAEYQQWLTMAETKGYTVQQQLMGNSISLWRQVATGGGVDTLQMLNGKKMIFDKDEFTMQGLPLNEKNVAATNGTLHTVKTVLPFKYNIYEYLKDGDNAADNNMSTFHNYIISKDTTYFSEESSIEGNPDINGNPTYVDSVYYTTNTMFFGTKRYPTNTNTEQYLTFDESFGGNIGSEDSTFIMLLPTDNAWENAYTKLEPLYNYASIYVDKDKENNGTTGVYRTIENTDSLKEKCINMDIASPLCFNLHYQPNAGGKIGRWQLDDFLADKGNSAEYLLNTFGDTLRSDSTWDKSILMQGTQIAASNGAGIVATEWNFPTKLYRPDLYIEVGYRSFFNTSENANSNAKDSPRAVSFSNALAKNWVDSVGRVSEDNFYYIYPASATGNPKTEFKLVGTHGENHESEVMSGKYDIYAVMVPNFYMTSSDTIVGDTVKHKLIATLSYCNNAESGKEATIKSDVIDYAGEKVDTLLLFENFEFPYSYKNLIYSYPTLMLTTKTTSSERKKGYSNAYCIDRIILRSKD